MEDETRVQIGSEADVAVAAQRGGALAERLGFSRTERTQVVTAISEVAGNIWLYAGRGSVELAPVDEPERVGLSVVAVDAGPGIADVDLALSDGYSTRGGMGLGLPGAMRLMDDFDVDSQVGRGTKVTMARWLAKPGATIPEPPLLDWSAADTPGEALALMIPFPNGVLLAAIAGLGRGDDAVAAAATAREVLESHPGESPVAIVQRCHDALHGGRRVALALASVSELDAWLTWLAVGRAEAVLIHPAPTEEPMSEAAPALHGVVGQRLPALRASNALVKRGDTLVLSSGGVALGRARFRRGVGERRPPAAR